VKTFKTNGKDEAVTRKQEDNGKKTSKETK